MAVRGRRAALRRAPLLAAALLLLGVAQLSAGAPPAQAQTTGLIALTFDDGPQARTNQVLDVLAQKGVRATFFLKTDQIPGHPAAFARTLAEGHEVADHTVSHPNLVTLLGDGGPAGVAAVRAEIAGARDAIVAAGGPEPVLFRPPYGATNAVVNGIAGELGLRLVLWNISSPRDYDAPRAGGAREVCRDVLAGAGALRRSGEDEGVVLLHDWNANTVGALPCIIDGLRAAGWGFGRIAPSTTSLPGVGAVGVVPWA